MDPEILDEQLSRISTIWTLVQQAHRGSVETVASAQRLLVERYSGAVYRYLLGALRDEEGALELFQEFALRFVRGDFRRADPERGRFRDYVKKALIHLVNDYRRAGHAWPGPLPADLPDPQSADPHKRDFDSDFLGSWREDLLNLTWDSLRREHPTQHAILLYHVENPNVPSPQAAVALSDRLGRSFTPGNVRILLHRARERFAELLIDEVTNSLASPTPENLLQELRELKLLRLCAPASGRRREMNGET